MDNLPSKHVLVSYRQNMGRFWLCLGSSDRGKKDRQERGARKVGKKGGQLDLIKIEIHFHSAEKIYRYNLSFLRLDYIHSYLCENLRFSLCA